MHRTRIRIHDMTFYLAQGHDPEQLKRDIVHAALVGAAFVEFVEVGNRRVSALITAGVTIVVEEGEVDADYRDDGNVLLPFVAPYGARSYTHLDFIDY